jgi:hypothetical protein
MKYPFRAFRSWIGTRLQTSKVWLRPIVRLGRRLGALPVPAMTRIMRALVFVLDLEALV